MSSETNPQESTQTPAVVAPQPTAPLEAAAPEAEVSVDSQSEVPASHQPGLDAEVVSVEPQPADQPELGESSDGDQRASQGRGVERRGGQGRGRPQSGGPRRPRGNLPPDDPFWSFGTPLSSWGTSGRGGYQSPPPRRGEPGILEAMRAQSREDAPDTDDSDDQQPAYDPELSAIRRPAPSRRLQEPRRRQFLECRRCGVKMERRAQHKPKTACPMCGQWMQLVEL